MRESIDETLKAIESEHGCRVLFAVESGSRAWGFASPDSDYDVRFVYAGRIEWYLDLREQRDTIERYYPNDIDCAGWDARKTLRLFAGCNVALHEWLGSPTVYRDEGGFLAEMQGLAPDYFNPQKAMHHYLGAARNIHDNHLEGHAINIKKLFYVVRPLLAAIWIAGRKSIPPVPFDALLDAGLLPDDLDREVRDLRESKRAAAERDATRISEELRKWMHEGLIHWLEVAHRTAPGRQPGWEPLNTLFHAAIGA